MIFAFPAPYWGPSMGSARVASPNRAGSANTSATVAPARSSSSNGKATSGSNMPSHCRSITRAVQPDLAPYRHARRGARLSRRQRPLGSGGLGSKPDSLLGAQFAQSNLLEDGEWRAGADTVENLSFGCNRSAACLVLGERGVEHRRALKYKAFRRADDAVDDRAFEQLPPGSDHDPTEPGEPAPHVQRL
jgi:hypothetical protein